MSQGNLEFYEYRSDKSYGRTTNPWSRTIFRKKQSTHHNTFLLPRLVWFTMESLAPGRTASVNTTGNKPATKEKRSFKKKPPSKRNTKDDKKPSKGKRDKNDKKIKVLKKGVASIEFDATARYEHLTGFSERKRARRAYGLAQQKIKDRKSKLEHRAAIRTAERDFIEEAEKLKQQHYHLQQQPHQHGTFTMNPYDDDDNQSVPMKKGDKQTTDEDETVQILFDSEETEQQWGGHVVVTTSTHIPGDSDNDDDDDFSDAKKIEKRRNTSENHDTEQAYAGNIEKYIKTIKGNLPSKKKRSAPPTANTSTSSSNKRTKGQHGATNMKGVGSAADMKVAQKMLSRSTTKITKGSSGGKKGRKGGKR